MSLRHDLIAMQIAQRLRESSRIDKPPLSVPTPAQRKATNKRAGLKGGMARKAMAAVKKLFGGQP